MRDWAIILGGLVVWTLHFLLVYGFASVADVTDPGARRLWAWLGIAGTGLCLSAIAWIAVEARSKRTAQGLPRALGLGGCTVSGIAVVWQSLPLFIAG
ncbi:hypothetical protein ACETK8_12005 [Brevundimonas staleyi]|uniref:Uncharacterized protein n=1 Tax=Brevundimonas staleyi TaxID=74326 RepID=A0ABW0FS70_9CAUL